MSKTSSPPVELWDVAKLVPYEHNAKKHPPEQIKALAASIKANGWSSLISVDKAGVVIAAHGRRLAAIELGLEKVFVICRRDLTPAQVDVLRLADNRMASTEYDQGLVQQEIARLSQELNLEDLAFTGYSSRELDMMLADLAVVPADIFVDDVAIAVEEQQVTNVAKVESVEKDEVPLAEAFGFKRITVPVSRRIKALMALLEEETGKKGIEALLAHAAELGA